MSDPRPRGRAPGRELPPDDAAEATVAFDRWLADGLAPDDRDRAAGRRLADAWRDRRRALAGAEAPRPPTAGWRRGAWWWAPLTVAALAAVAVVAWPTPLVVDHAALAGAYLDALGSLPMGAP